MSNIKFKTPNEVAEKKRSDLVAQINTEAAQRILLQYPADAIPGRYEALSNQERTAMDAIGRQIAEKSKELRDQAAQGGKPDFENDATWPGRGKGRN